MNIQDKAENALAAIWKPVERIPGAFREQIEQGTELMRTGGNDPDWYDNAVNRAMGFLQAGFAPINAPWQALFEEPVSENLQNAGMSKRAADLTALGLSVALPMGTYAATTKAGMTAPFLTELWQAQIGKNVPQAFRALTPLERQRGMVQFHGGPHKWKPEPGRPAGRPRLDKMGTGEGAQAYGWGFYSADRKGVAGNYADKLTNKRPEGMVYKLDIPDSETAKYLDWNKSLSEQPHIMQAYKQLHSEVKNRIPLKDQYGNETTGGQFYNALANYMRGGKSDNVFDGGTGKLGQKEASEELASLGIPGLKFFDSGSRGKKFIQLHTSNGPYGDPIEFFDSQMDDVIKDYKDKGFKVEVVDQGTRNYVTWDQGVLDRSPVLEVNGQPVPKDPDIQQLAHQDVKVDPLKKQRGAVGDLSQLDDSLYITHNLSADNLMAADRLGGLAAPSLAIGDINKGAITGYGDISLLADKKILSSPKAKTFDADIYSPRQPRATETFNNEGWAAYHNRAKSLAERAGIPTDDYRFDVPSYSESLDGYRDLRWKLFARAEYLDSIGQWPRFKKGDYEAFRDAVGRKFNDPKIVNGYEDHLENLRPQLVDKEQLFQGFTYSGNRRYKPYTLENVVRAMTRELKGGEGFMYGAGNVRAHNANRLKDVKAVKRAKHKLTSTEGMKGHKDEMQEKLFALMDRLKPYYKYEANSMGYYDDAADAIGTHTLREAFEDIPQDLRTDIYNYIDELGNAPTEYFESKMQRAVGLNEFSVAVVPRGTRETVVQKLKDSGLKIRYYKAGDETDRARAIRGGGTLFEMGGAMGAGAIGAQALLSPEDEQAIYKMAYPKITQEDFDALRGMMP